MSLSTIKEEIIEHDKYNITIHVVSLNPFLFDMITKEKVKLKLNNLQLISKYLDFYTNTKNSVLGNKNVLGNIVLSHIPYMNKNNFVHTINNQLTEYSKNKIINNFSKNSYGSDFLDDKIQDVFYTKDYFILRINNYNYAFINDAVIKLYNNDNNVFYNDNMFLTYSNKRITYWKTMSTKNAYTTFNISKVVPKNEIFIISDSMNKHHYVLDNDGFHRYNDMICIELGCWVMLYNDKKIIIINSKENKSYVIKDCFITRKFIELLERYKTAELFVKNVFIIPSMKTNH
jgi:hypothetical protein